MKEYLVESALLAHGLKSISNKQLLSVWKSTVEHIAWVEKGKICIGNIQNFCEFRSKASTYGRINYFNFENSLREGKTGCLTASGVIKVCEFLNIPIVVTCGIGGIMSENTEKICHDIEAMAKSSVSLVATAPKDMFSLEATMKGLKKKNIQVVGIDKDYCNGYIFAREKVKLDRKWNGEALQEKTLYLKEISDEKKLEDSKILEEAYYYGKEQEKRGHLFHPAVNGKIDEITKGQSSEIQLESLWENVLWVEDVLLKG